jgi:glycerophosphoryl diester phosphodiesterase
LEEALVERLEAYDMIEQGQVLVQSFDQESLLKVRDLNQDVPLIQLLWYSPSEQDNATLTEWNNTTPGADTIRDEDFERIAEYAVGIGTNAIYQGQPVIDADFVHQAQKNGLSVHVYTINEQEDMKRVMALGVNGLFTDYPDRLLELVSD